MVLFVNVMFEYESFDDWSWLRTGGGGGGGDAASLRGHSVAHITLPYALFMCKTGLFLSKLLVKYLFYGESCHFGSC